MPRRFDDTLPPLEPLEPIRDSNWDKLSDSERADLLRHREAAMLDRHRQLMAGLSALRSRAEAHAGLLKTFRHEVENELKPMLKVNTEATQRTEESVNALKESTAAVVKLWTDLQGAGSLAGRIGTLTKDLAWIVLPVTAVVGGWQAFLAWAKAGFPGLK